MDAVDAQPGKVPWSVPRNLVAGVGKAVGVEIGGEAFAAIPHSRQSKATECMLVPVLSWEHTTWGRWVPFARRALDMPRAIGCPDCSVMIVASDQPPTTASTARFILPPIHCLRPMGRSTTTAAASRCGVSLPPMLCSADRRSSCCGMPRPSAPTQLFLPADESSVDFDIV